MCWAVGSVQEATQGRCRMCRTLDFRGECPHETQVCTQRKMHPDFDVRHYVNAEVRWTNACGFCKWAKANGAADPKQNRGWPGCCRPPTSKEWVMVKDPGAASVIARLHEVTIPDNIRAALEQTQRQMQQLQPDGTGAASTGGPRPPPSAPVAIPSRSRSDSSPQTSGSVPNGMLPLVPPGTKTRLADEQALSAALSPPEERKQPPVRRLSVGSSAALASAVVHREPVHATPTPRSNAPPRPPLNHKKSGSLQQITAALSASSISRQNTSAQVFSDSDSSSTVRSEFTDYLSDATPPLLSNR
ncbi:hypothetical protein EXIGLDRAFT_21534 [Exidia glandulosa HHB12029]|uniref:Uncharacterized protein n=1 Tax=Exidia glandulosa HHB12029 TaxID=1314781 RepID=A0A165QZG1_EXIGL|nr:hypothetical protein EXIGLDRAFT_21534 [Exidia glandulosa HHB12029]